jgi:predicted RNase H-like HicB family nuclease
MRKDINIVISWSGDNYCAGTGEIEGVVVATSKTIDGVKKEFEDAFEFHIEAEDSIENYTLNYQLQTSALLRKLDGFVTRAALSRVTGINEQQLSHYITGHRNPRQKQREKIIEGIHKIGYELINVV